MEREKKHTIKLSETDMRLIKKSIEESAYLGLHSERVTKIKKKMSIKQKQPAGAKVTEIN